MTRPHAKTILVTGGTGLLGKGLEETLPPGWRIVSVHQRDYAVEGSPSRHLVLDIRDKRAVDQLFAENAFDAVVHAAGIASVDYVEKHFAESLESNIVGTLNVTSAARRAGTHLIYISTNAVFDGKKAPYREDDPVAPVNKYGGLKVECERLVRETLEHWTIVRPILMYGWNHSVTAATENAPRDLRSRQAELRRSAAAKRGGPARRPVRGRGTCRAGDAGFPR